MINPDKSPNRPAPIGVDMDDKNLQYENEELESTDVIVSDETTKQRTTSKVKQPKTKAGTLNPASNGIWKRLTRYPAQS